MASICSIHSIRQPIHHDGSALSLAQRETTDDQWPEYNAYDLLWRFERESAYMDPSDSAQPSEEPAGSHASPLVLIVDDEAPIAEALALIVEEAGYATLTAFRGPAGLALAREHHPALIFTDMMMPQLDGAALIETLRLDATVEQVASAGLLRTDGQLTAAVWQILSENPALAPSLGRLRVQVRDGEVTLLGALPSPRHRASAEQDIWHLPGVIAVRNETTLSE